MIDQVFIQHKIDVVVHLAARAGVRPSINNPEEYYSTNVLGTLNILNAMKKHAVSRMIFASSSSVYGNNRKVPFAENDNVDYPISPYAATKKASELLCHTFHHLYNFDIFCLRFFTVFGPRQRPDLAINKFTDLILEGKNIEVFGDGTSARDYTYITDIVDGITASMNVLKGYEIINLGESRPIQLTDMVDALALSLNKPVNKINKPMQPGDVQVTFADITKAKKMIGYEPKWNFNDGIHEFIKWKLA